MTTPLSIAIPALALVVLVMPGTPRWLRKPWFAEGPPRRTYLAGFFALLLLIAVIRAA